MLTFRPEAADMSRPMGCHQDFKCQSGGNARGVERALERRVCAHPGRDVTSGPRLESWPREGVWTRNERIANLIGGAVLVPGQRRAAARKQGPAQLNNTGELSLKSPSQADQFVAHRGRVLWREVFE